MENASGNSGVGCVYCGAAPAPHFMLWFETAMSLYFDRPMRSALKPLVILFTPFVRWLTNVLMHAFFLTFRMLGVVSFHAEYEGETHTRLSVIFEEAKGRGIRIETIRIRGKQISYARAWLPAGAHLPFHSWHYFEHMPVPPWKESPLFENLDNKLELKRLLLRHGIPVPQGSAFMRRTSALRFFKELRAPAIVKPLEGSRARHTRVRVDDEADFSDALARALAVCPLALVEEFIEGDVHRVVCVEGKFIACMRFVRPVIVADGGKSADELRREYNAALAYPLVTPVKDDALFSLTLAHQGLRKEDIPQKGTLLRLADFSERTNGGYNEDVTDAIPPERIALFERAARVSRLPVVGFDVISKDITDSRAMLAFLEANTAPFIEIHSEPTVGAPRNVASAVWDLWRKSGRS